MNLKLDTAVDVGQCSSRSDAGVVMRLGPLGGTIESRRSARTRIFWITLQLSCGGWSGVIAAMVVMNVEESVRS